MKRGQAAIEFLITNGWAILVVVILLAVLFYIGVLSPQNTTPNTCLFQPGFSCYTFKVGNVTGSLELDFGQATGKSIQVTGISCSQNSTAALHTSPLAEDVTVPSGEHRWIVGGTSPNSGITCEGATGVAGTRYKGTACIAYLESGTNAQRLVCGEINARLEPASAVQPGGSPTPFPTPPPGAINLTECGQTYDQPGYYYLDSDLNDTDGGYCITLAPDASNSTLDCYGHTINSIYPYSGIGIYLQSATNITVRHCTITNFWAGIYAEYSSYDTITDNTATSNSEGIYSYGFSDSRIINNDFSSNSDCGINIYSATNNNFTGNTVTGNSNYGFYADSGSSNNLLTRNTACWNQNMDVQCDAGQADGNSNICRPYGESVCSGSITCNPTCPPTQPPACAPGWVVSSCPCTLSVPGNYTLETDLNDSTGNGCITMTSGASGSNLDCNGNAFNGYSQSGIGIYLQGGSSGITGVAIRNCTVSNFSMGIYLEYTNDTELAGNNIVNDYFGAYLSNSVGNTLTSNIVDSNQYSGIYATGSSSSSIDGNIISNNAYYGLYLDSSQGSNVTNNNINTTTYGNCMEIYGSSNATISGNQLQSCTNGGGLIVGNCGSSTIIGNTADSSASGIVIYSSPDSIVSGNIASFNTGTGIYISDASGTSITGNIVNQNGNNGFETYSDSLTFSGNTACWNGWENIYCDRSQSDGSGNTCKPEGPNATCYNSVSCSAGCPVSEPPACAPNWAVSSCPCTLGVTGNYTLSSDLNYTNDCIIFYPGASGSTLDCLGKTITGPGGAAGIHAYFMENVTIRNCTITNFGHGIAFEHSNHSTILDNNLTANTYTGIYLYDSANNTVSGNTIFSDAWAGVYLQGGSNGNNFTSNNATGTPYDFYCDGNSNVNNDLGNTCDMQSGCSLSDGGWLYTCPAGASQPCGSSITSCCTMLSQGDYTVTQDINASYNCIIIPSGASGSTLDCGGNSINGTSMSGYGIYLNGASRVAVRNCSLSNFNFGIFLQRSSGNTLVSDTAYSNNVGFGLVDSSSSNLVEGNNLSGNSNSGIQLQYSSDNNLTGNTANSNGVGMMLYYSSDNNFTGNSLLDNNNYGFESSSSSNDTFTDNSACRSQQGFMCDTPQNDSGGNVCTPLGAACSSSITCHSGCPLPPPPACAPDWVVGACGCTLNVPGTYTINASGLTSSGSGNCITMTTTGVSLDCQNRAITSTSQSGTGIYINWVNGVTVENCVVSNFSYDIWLYHSNGDIITGNTANSSSTNGIMLYYSSNNNLTGNNASSNINSGIYLYSSSNNIITGNTVNSDNMGITMYSSGSNTLTGNTANSNNMGIYADSSSSNNLAGNTACNNMNDLSCGTPQTDGTGNVCQSGDACGVTCGSGCPLPPCASGGVISSCGCFISAMGDYSLDGDLLSSGGNCIGFGQGASGSTLDCHGHSITNPLGSFSGIYLYATTGMTVRNCNVHGFCSGLMIRSSNGSDISDNTFSSSGCYGIQLFSSSTNNNLTGNTVDVNSNQGIYTDSSSGNNNLMDNTVCWNPTNYACDSRQNDLGSNICTPYGGSVCSGSIACNPTCPSPSPPACAPGWVVSSCPCVLSVPGDYTLNQDLVTTGDCIRMTSDASGSTVDCQHHTITCNAGDWCGNNGITLIRVNGSTVENCNVRNFYTGIYLSSSNSNSIRSNTASSNNRVSYGIIVSYSNGNILTGNNASSNRNYGIDLESSSNNNDFTSNTATGNTQSDFYCGTQNSNNDSGNTCSFENCDWLTCR